MKIREKMEQDRKTVTQNSEVRPEGLKKASKAEKRKLLGKMEKSFSVDESGQDIVLPVPLITKLNFSDPVDLSCPAPDFSSDQGNIQLVPKPGFLPRPEFRLTRTTSNCSKMWSLSSSANSEHRSNAYERIMGGFVDTGLNPSIGACAGQSRSAETANRRRRLSKTKSIDQETLEENLLQNGQSMTQRTSFSDGSAVLMENIGSNTDISEQHLNGNFFDDELNTSLSTILSIRPLTSSADAKNRTQGVRKISTTKKSSAPNLAGFSGNAGSQEDLTVYSGPVPTLASRERKAGMFFIDSSFPQEEPLPDIGASSRGNSSKTMFRPVVNPNPSKSPPSSARSLLFTQNDPTKMAGNELQEQVRPSTRALSIISIDDQIKFDEESQVGDQLDSRASSRRSHMTDRRRQFARKPTTDPIRRSFDSENAIRRSTDEGDFGIGMLTPHLESPPRIPGKVLSSDCLPDELRSPTRLTPHSVVPPIGARAPEVTVEAKTTGKIEKIVKDETLKDLLMNSINPLEFAPDNPSKVFDKVLEEKKQKMEKIEEVPGKEVDTRHSSFDVPELTNQNQSSKTKNAPMKNEVTFQDKNLDVPKKEKNSKTGVSPSRKTSNNKTESESGVNAREVSKSAANVEKQSTEREKTQKEISQNINKAKQKTSKAQGNLVTVIKNSNPPNERPKAAITKGTKITSKNQGNPGSDKPKPQNDAGKKLNPKIELESQNGSTSKTNIGFKGGKVLTKKAKNKEEEKPSPLDKDKNVIQFRFDGASIASAANETPKCLNKPSADGASSSQSSPADEKPVEKKPEESLESKSLGPKKSTSDPNMTHLKLAVENGPSKVSDKNVTPVIKNAMESIVREEPAKEPVLKVEIPQQKALNLSPKRNISKAPPKQQGGKQNQGAKKPAQKGNNGGKPTKKTSNGKIVNEDIIPNKMKGPEREKSNIEAIYKTSDPTSSALISGQGWHISVPIVENEGETENFAEDGKNLDKDLDVPEVLDSKDVGESFSSSQRRSYEENEELQLILGNTLLDKKRKLDFEEEDLEETILDVSGTESDSRTLLNDDAEDFINEIDQMLEEEEEELQRPLTGDPFKEITPRLSARSERSNRSRELSTEQKLDSDVVDKNVNPENSEFPNDRPVYVINEESWGHSHGTRSTFSGTSTSSSFFSDEVENETPRSHSKQSHQKLENFQFAFRKGDREDGKLVYWRKGQKLGHGAFGTVWQGLTSTGQLVAVKQLQVGSDNETQAKEEHLKLQEEVNMLKTLKHKNIVKYIGTTIDDNMLNIFMEYIPGGTIASILKTYGNLTEKLVAAYTWQLVNAVIYLHDNHVVHRDIKGSNLMLMSDGTIKLIDFGCAKKMAMNLTMTRSKVLKSMKGTPYWMSPEVIKETGHGPKSDVWSLGCTVFEMATGKPPWAEMVPMAALFAIGSAEKPVPQLSKDNFSTAAVHFVSQCLVREESERPNANELLNLSFLAEQLARSNRKSSKSHSQNGA